MKPTLSTMTDHPLYARLRGFVTGNPWYSGAVLAPLLVIAVYQLLICSDSYMSRAQLIIERESQASLPQLDLGLLGMGSNVSKLDALLIQEFVRSRAMLEFLDRKLNLRAHYAADDVDFVSSLDEDASEEDFLDYYRDRLTVDVDSESYIVTIALEAYTPEFARKVADAVVARAEEFVNDVNRTLAREKVDFVQGEIEQANERLKKASTALVSLQRRNELLSPAVETETMSRIIAGLQEQIAQQRAQMKNYLAYLNRGAPEVVATQKRIAALERQLEQERSRQVGGDDAGVNELLLQYKEAELSVTVAADLYQTGLKTLEAVRLDASRKVKYVVQISPPSMPGEAAYPRPLYALGTAFAFLNLGYLVLMLGVAAVRDHVD